MPGNKWREGDKKKEQGRDSREHSIECLHTQMRTLRSRDGRVRVRGSEGPNTELKSRSLLIQGGVPSFLLLRV